MSINADILLDRLQLKTQITRWRAIAIIALAVAALASVGKLAGVHPMRGEYIARISVEGVIADDKELLELIRDMKDDPAVKAVVVELDTPGGTAVGGQELYLALRDVSATKPVVANMRNIATSAGYLTAVGADYIVAREGTITGSIGVILQMAEFTELADKIGIKPVVIKSGPLKGSPSPVEKMSPEAEKAIQEMINDFYGWFVDTVAERRKLPREQVVHLADGRVYSGPRAVQLKLVDALGGEKEALKWLQDNKKIDKKLEIYDVKPTNKELGILNSLAQSFAGKLWPESSAGLDGLLSIWHPHSI